MFATGRQVVSFLTIREMVASTRTGAISRTVSVETAGAKGINVVENPFIRLSKGQSTSLSLVCIIDYFLLPINSTLPGWTDES